MAFTRFVLRQLEVFRALIELRSFTATGERLGISTQAVSQSIADLEAVVGFRLFDRTTRRVVLTGAGHDFSGPAQTILRHIAAAELAADDVRHRATGLVRIGAPLVLASMALPAVTSSFSRGASGIVVRIRDLPVAQLVDSVASGDVDLAVGADRPCGPELSSQALFVSRWVLWCAPNHPLAKATQVRWADLRHHPVVAAGRDHERSVAQMRLSTPDDLRVTPVDVVDNISTALGIASQGLAVTLAPAYVGAMARLMGLVMCRVIEPEALRTVNLYRPVNREPSPSVQAFALHLQQALPVWNKAAGESDDAHDEAGRPAGADAGRARKKARRSGP